MFGFCKASNIKAFTIILIIKIPNVKSDPKVDHCVSLCWIKADQSQSISTQVYFKLKIISLYPVLYTYLTISHPICVHQTQSDLIKPNQSINTLISTVY